ncbi:MAG: putative heme transporter [Solirubrobacteraceae bacterium]
MRAPAHPRRTLRAEPIAPPGAESLPDDFAPRRLLRRLLEAGALLVVVVLVALLAPGLGQVRDRLAEASPGWLVLAVAFEALSCTSYVLMFRAVFCRRISWRTSAEIGWAELAAGSLVPASGAGGLALGAWILRRGGMSVDHIARRSVAFFLIKSSVNFVAVAVLGTLMAVGIVGPHKSWLLTALPAALSVAVIVAVLAIPRLGPGADPGPEGSKLRRAWIAVRGAVIKGTAEAVELVRSRDAMVIVGSIGYWAWDNAVLWATFQAVGADVPLSIVLMGYLIGQLGGLLPIPGGVGGIDGGLIGTLVVFGAPAAATTAAVLAYRVILFWLPLVGGAVAFISLRRALDDAVRPDLCEPVPA